MKVNIGPYKNDGEQDIEVVIDDFDTISLYTSLAIVIVPALKRYRQDLNGGPTVSDLDVPFALQSTNAPKNPNPNDFGFVDEHFHARWEWVLDEMIWAFEQVLIDWEEQYCEGPYDTWDHDGMAAHQNRIDNGLILFGKYYQSLWD